MLASIHPLGERARNNRWGTTVGWYVAGSLAGGAAAGALAGSVGWVLLGSWHAAPMALAVSAAVLCLVAAGVDLAGGMPTVPRRQVNEDWLAVYRGWVYGGGFGVQLGMGFVTVVTTATLPLAFALAVVAASPAGGAAIGAGFGLARAVPLLGMGRVRRTDSLRRVHQRMQSLYPLARRATVGAALVAAGALAGVVVAGGAVARVG